VSATAGEGSAADGPHWARGLVSDGGLAGNNGVALRASERRRNMRRVDWKRARKLAIAMLVFALGLMSLPATASAAQSDGDDTVSGTCHMTGEIVFKEGVGLEPEEVTFTNSAEGTCTGTVNGEYMANERVYLKGSGGGVLSCGANRVEERGYYIYTRNTATRSDDVQLDWTGEYNGLVGQIASTMHGRVSGEAVGFAQFRDDGKAMEECEAGRFRGGAYEGDGSSVTPMVG
jgi:hypothetical protein